MIVHPVACVGGRWIGADSHPRWLHRNPSDWDDILGEVPSACEAEIRSAVLLATKAQAAWQNLPQEGRAERLLSWAQRLGEREDAFAQFMATEVGKPLSEGRIEVRRALETLQATVRIHGGERIEKVSAEVVVRHRPLGVVAAVTPWNNPVAIPVGKMAPALIFGNAVVWKPAVQAPHTARLLMETLQAAGIPPGLVNVVFGAAQTARWLIAHPGVMAVSLTGSNQTGRRTAILCGRLLKPFQAELGGNNSAIVMPDCEPEAVAWELAVAAFSFAGQRCTANRRLIVHNDILPQFEAAMVAAVEALVVGDPLQSATQVGPLISRTKQHQMGRIVAKARRDGAHLLTGGQVPKQWHGGCWYQPTLLRATASESTVVQEESFGPLAVIQPARDIEEAMRLGNGVAQGLVASLYCRDPAIIRHFLAAAEAGNIKLNQPTLGVDLRAPFTGWKASGLGPGEHGQADREFYARTQAVYGWSS
ncbi:MAG: aldehyde dehydrogenase family protein [Thiobacillus sp.]